MASRFARVLWVLIGVLLGSVVVGQAQPLATVGGVGVEPPEGDPGTAFQFSVTYTNAANAAPAYAYLVVVRPGAANLWLPMATSDQTYTDGSLFTCSQTLPVGAYSCYAEFSVGGQVFQSPVVAGPVVQAPAPPSLAGAAVSPQSGDESTSFAFTVTYTNRAGAAPDYAYVVIVKPDATKLWVAASTADVVYTDGSVFTCTQTLPVGAYSFYFEFMSGGALLQTPTVAGPVVVTPPPFAVSGVATLSGQTDHAGTTITFARVSGTGAIPAAVQTAANGAWSASGFASGTVYRATPSRSGWGFTPASSEFAAATTTLDFAGQLPAYAVSGIVTLEGQTSHAGTTVTFARLSGTGATPGPVQTDATGAWSATGFAVGSTYQVTPTRAGWTFNPASSQFSAATSSLTFTGQQTPFGVSGVATLTGQSDHSGTTVSFSRVAGTGAVPAAVQTSASGAWSATGFAPGTTYLATPSRTGWTFTPASSQFSGATSALSFAGQPATYGVSGVATLSGQASHSGITIAFTRVSGTGAVPASVQTNASGAWAASGFQVGSTYLATPTRTGWVFTPASSQFAAASSTVNFAGQLAPFAIAGVATLSGQADHSGTTIAFALLSGTGAVPTAAQTNAAGAWSATGFTPGSTYLVTPYRTGWTFAPASAGVSAATTGLSFTGSRFLTGLLVRAVVGSARLTSPAQIVVGRRAVIEVLGYGAADQHDSSLVATFDLQVPAALGAASGGTALRLTTVAGVTGSLQVTAEGRTASFQITTLPGAVDRLVIQPATVSLSPGQQVDFDARGADAYGNVFALTGVNVAWHCVPAMLGTITSSGLFTAGSASVEGYVLAAVSRSLRFGDTDVASAGSGKVVVRAALPNEFVLHQNTPNPFNPETTISFELAEAGPVRLEVFDSAGRRVQVLTDQQLAAGPHALRWDGTDGDGHALGTGVYLVRLTAGQFVAVRKAMLLR